MKNKKIQPKSSHFHRVNAWFSETERACNNNIEKIRPYCNEELFSAARNSCDNKVFSHVVPSTALNTTGTASWSTLNAGYADTYEQCSARAVTMGKYCNETLVNLMRDRCDEKFSKKIGEVALNATSTESNLGILDGINNTLTTVASWINDSLSPEPASQVFSGFNATFINGTIGPEDLPAADEVISTAELIAAVSALTLTGIAVVSVARYLWNERQAQHRHYDAAVEAHTIAELS